MTQPKRVQLRRTKGWRLPEGAVVVSRPTKWGNPFRYGHKAYGLVRVPGFNGRTWDYEGRVSAPGMQHDYQHPGGTWTRHTIRLATREETVELYRLALIRQPTEGMRCAAGAGQSLVKVTVQDAIRELEGRDLACWCPLVDDTGEPVPCHADVLLARSNPGAWAEPPF